MGAGVFTYNYVGDTGMLSRLDLPNGSRTEQQYDSLHRLTQVQNLGAGNANLASYAYGYDDRDVRTGVTSQVGQDPLKQIAYAYDAVDQLVGESATGGVQGSTYTNTFQYDSMGNRKRVENVSGGNSTVTRSTPNDLNQLSALSTSQNGGAGQNVGLSYDASGNLTQVVGTDGSKTLYTYDDADRLIRIENRSAANAPVSKSEFVYDYASRKAISREFSYSNGAWNKTSETRRVFSGLDVIQERNAANEATAQYTRDGNIGGILARTSPSGHSYFHYDGGGNVTALSDETGNLVGRYSYDAFGNTLEASGPRAAENPYRFSTKEWHAASGMVDFGCRFYSPGMGRWLNRDPIRESGGVNLYGFVGNNPVNAVDAYGLTMIVAIFKPIIGSVGLYHAYLLVSDTANGRPIGTPRFFRGGYVPMYEGSGRGRIQVQYGNFLPGSVDYNGFNSEGGRIVFLNNDNVPFNAVVSRCRDVADRIQGRNFPYLGSTSNSNSTVFTILQEGFGINPLTYGDAPSLTPGWGENLLRRGNNSYLENRNVVRPDPNSSTFAW